MLMDEKIVETISLQDWKVWNGRKMAPAKALHVTRPFTVWKVKTRTKEIECADFHFLFYEDGCKVMAYELHPGDLIQVDGGIDFLTQGASIVTDHHAHDYGLSGHFTRQHQVMKLFLTDFTGEELKVWIPAYRLSVSHKKPMRAAAGAVPDLAAVMQGRYH